MIDGNSSIETNAQAAKPNPPSASEIPIGVRGFIADENERARQLAARAGQSGGKAQRAELIRQMQALQSSPEAQRGKEHRALLAELERRRREGGNTNDILQLLREFAPPRSEDNDAPSPAKKLRWPPRATRPQIATMPVLSSETT